MKGKAIELAVALLESKLDLALKCVRYDLVYLSQRMYTQDDINALENRIQILRGSAKVKFGNSDLAEKTLRYFRHTMGEKMAASKAAELNPEIKKQALDVCVKMNFVLTELEKYG